MQRVNAVLGAVRGAAHLEILNLVILFIIFYSVVGRAVYAKRTLHVSAEKSN